MAVGWTAVLCPLSPVPQHLWLSEAVPPPRSSSMSTPGPPRLFSPLSPAAESGGDTTGVVVQCPGIWQRLSEPWMDPRMPGLGLGLGTAETGRSGRRGHVGRGSGWCPELRVGVVPGAEGRAGARS